MAACCAPRALAAICEPHALATICEPRALAAICDRTRCTQTAAGCTLRVNHRQCCECTLGAAPGTMHPEVQPHPHRTIAQPLVCDQRRAPPGLPVTPHGKKARQFLIQPIGRIASSDPWLGFVCRQEHSEALTSNLKGERETVVKRVQHSTGGTTHQSSRSHATQFIRCTTPSSA